MLLKYKFLAFVKGLLPAVQIVLQTFGEVRIACAPREALPWESDLEQYLSLYPVSSPTSELQQGKLL